MTYKQMQKFRLNQAYWGLNDTKYISILNIRPDMAEKLVIWTFNFKTGTCKQIILNAISINLRYGVNHLRSVRWLLADINSIYHRATCKITPIGVDFQSCKLYNLYLEQYASLYLVSINFKTIWGK